MDIQLHAETVNEHNAVMNNALQDEQSNVTFWDDLIVSTTVYLKHYQHEVLVLLCVFWRSTCLW